MDESIFDVGNVFADGSVLSEEYTPDDLPEREHEIKEIAKAMRRPLRGENIQHVWVEGKTGQGKTDSIRRMLDLYESRLESEEYSHRSIWINCRYCPSTYEIACRIVEEYTGENPNGHPQSEVLDRMYAALDGSADVITIVLDEVDALGQKDEILYNIPRAASDNRLTKTTAGLICVTNDRSYKKEIDKRATSSLYDRHIIFDAYQASDLRNILKRRAEMAFRDGIIDQSAIAKSAALAAEDEGSARQAIGYLYEAGEIADDEGLETIDDDLIDRAQEKVREREITQQISSMTVQDQLALVGVVILETMGETPARTRRVYTEYSNYTEDAEANTLSYDRLREHLKELDLMGVLNSQTRTGDEIGGKKLVWELSVDVGQTLDAIQDLDDSRVAECLRHVSERRQNNSLSKYL